MLIWLLPWEKLLPAILGSLLIVFGSVGLFQYPPFFWHQAEAGIMLIAGISTFIHGVKQLIQPQPDDVKSTNEQVTRRHTQDLVPPDFSKYDEDKLFQVLRRIDRERFPERAAEVEARLAGLTAARETGR